MCPALQDIYSNHSRSNCLTQPRSVVQAVRHHPPTHTTWHQPLMPHMHVSQSILPKAGSVENLATLLVVAVVVVEGSWQCCKVLHGAQCTPSCVVGRPSRQPIAVVPGGTYAVVRVCMPPCLALSPSPSGGMPGEGGSPTHTLSLCNWFGAKVL
jgi:hypothetical protein